MVRILRKIYSLLLVESSFMRRRSMRSRFAGRDIHADAVIDGFVSIGAGCSISKDVVIDATQGQVHLGEKIWIGPRTLVQSGGYLLKIGMGSSVQAGCFLVGEVKIGSAVVIAPNVYASSGNHFFDIKPHLPIRDQDNLAPLHNAIISSPINIEDDCWIGINVAVMRGVTIGRGSIIGANAVVTKDIPPYSIAVGNPARAIKQRLDFSPPTVINSENLEDLPYFYSGFRFLHDDREKYINKGLVAQSEFSLALKTFNEQKRIVLTCSLLDKGRNYILRHDGVSIPLTEKETTIEFIAKL